MRVASLTEAFTQIKTPTDAAATENGAKLWRAARLGQLPRVQRLLKLGADVSYRCNEYGTTALHQAVSNSHQDVVQALLEADASVDDEDHQGRTVLHFATSADVVETLIMAGADVDHENREGKTPGRLALESKSKAVVEALINGRADPSKIYGPRDEDDGSRFATAGDQSKEEETESQCNAPEVRDQLYNTSALDVGGSDQRRRLIIGIVSMSCEPTLSQFAYNLPQIFPGTDPLDVTAVYAVGQHEKSPEAFAKNQQGLCRVTKSSFPPHKDLVHHMVHD